MDTPSSAAELLGAMIAMDTVTPRSSGRPQAERPLAEWLTRVAAEWGMRAEWLPIDPSLQPTDGAGELAPNLLVWAPESESPAGSGGPWLVFDGHLDTVAVDGMTVPPFGGPAASTNDRIVGRGASDAKGCGAAMLWALKEAHEANALAGPVAVLFTVGEETNQVGAQSFARYDGPRLRDERGWAVGGLVVGEPTGMQTIATTGGFLRWRITTRGVAAHSSRPERGRNAIDDMAHVLVALERDYTSRLTARHPLVGKPACSVTLLEGGAQHNIVPERCAATIDRRLIPGESPAAELAAVAAALRGVEAERPGITIEHHNVESAPPMDLPPNESLAAWGASALSESGVASEIRGEPYTTNANHYAAAGLPCVVVGPGDIAQAHTKDEFLGLADLDSGVRGYGALMSSWRGGDSR